MSNHGKESTNEEGVNIDETQMKIDMGKLITTKLDLSNARVFGCGAHMFLPNEIRKNKLSACSELMVFLGFEGPNYKFMRLPNNMLFVSPQAIFNETHFPKSNVKAK
jgi:hypothetical protein